MTHFLTTHSSRRTVEWSPRMPLIAAAIVANVACVSNERSELEKVSREYFNGTPVAAEQSGHATFNSCSFELITNTWLLGAGHCVGGNPIGQNMTMGSQARTIDQRQFHPKWDAALIRVSQPFTMGGSPNSHRLHMFSGPNTALLGSTATCYGYGRTSFNGPPGNLTKADLPITNVLPNTNVDPLENASVEYSPNAAGQFECGGDSGSSCFVGPHIVGIQNAGNEPCNPAQSGVSSGVGAESIREWIFSVIGHEFPVSGSTPDDILLSGVSGWGSLPLATSNGNGSFTVTNGSVYTFGAWSATADVRRLSGDFNGDGRVDLALTGPGSWNFLPVALSHNNGGFRIYQRHPGDFPAWSSASSVKRVVIDANEDLKSDIALIGNSSVSTFRFATSTGDGTFNPLAKPEAAGSHLTAAQFNQLADVPGVVALTGSFGGGGGSGDIALVGGPAWLSVPTAMTGGTGSSFTVTTRNWNVLQFAIAARNTSTKKLAADFDGDGRSDILLLGPAGSTVFRLARGMGNGDFQDLSCSAGSGDLSAEQFNNLSMQSEVAALVGDYDGNGNADVALTGGLGWQSIPVAFFNGCSVVTTNKTVGDGVFTWGAWASPVGVAKLSGKFTSDNRSDIALTGGAGWQSIPVARSDGGGFFTVTNFTVPNFGGWAETLGAEKFVGDVR